MPEEWMPELPSSASYCRPLNTADSYRLLAAKCPSLMKLFSAKIMTDQLASPPVLSTPDTHAFEDPTPLIPTKSVRLTDSELHDVYEISRTAEEISLGSWRRIALQFPDGMLHDAPRVFEALQAALANQPGSAEVATGKLIHEVTKDLQEVDIAKLHSTTPAGLRRRLFILADTSYGACCVDEIAAEHVEADVVVHYGRSCLSPTARLPVIYVFTSQPLAPDPVITSFEETFPKKDSKVILMSDVTYSKHLPSLADRLESSGYSNVFVPTIIHDPTSPIPNRTTPPAAAASEDKLQEYSLFHISDPPASLLLTLSSRLKSMFIYPTTNDLSASPRALQAQTSHRLRRRYALLTSLTTCSIFGILINTLSVKNYLPMISTIQAQLAAAGKKSYTFVVGKVNAAKVANFSEVGGWVVVGCWESSLIESSEFYRPIITPFELGLALMSDAERIWTGEWTADFSSILTGKTPSRLQQADHAADDGEIGDEDSAPPEFDLRTGRYVSHSRPMRSTAARSSHEPGPAASSKALMKRGQGELASVNGTASPGAEYLRSQRTWKGLGSDFAIAYEEAEPGATMEEGQHGVARGYTVGEDGGRR